MCNLTPLADEAPNLARDNSGTVMSCVFCGSDKASGMEVDNGIWAVCCCWCGTIGPHAKSIQLAVARWNAPLGDKC